LVRAVILLVVLALGAGEIGTNLSADTRAVTNLDLCDFGADLDNLTNDLVSDAEGKGNLRSPASTDGVDIRSANTACVDGNVDVVLLELLKGNLEKD
jgi:hypothetical protein